MAASGRPLKDPATSRGSSESRSAASRGGPATGCGTFRRVRAYPRLFRALCWVPLVVLLGGAIGVSAAADEPPGYKVIVHASNPIDALSRAQLSLYFLRKSRSWPSGRPIAAVDLEKGSPTRAAFSQDVLHKSVAEVIAYWRQQIFAGRAVPPAEKRGDAEVVAFVEANEGAIGYVSPNAAIAAAKIVKVSE